MKHSAIIALTFLLGLILDSQTALAGAKEGVALCIATLVPSLFPFLLACTWLSGSIGSRKQLLFGRIGAPMLIGLLGGYPTGAQAVARQVKAGQLSHTDGEKMLGYSCNAGPAFIFGMGATLFSGLWPCLLLWLIHAVSALAVAAILPPSTGKSRDEAAVAVSLPSAMQSALRSMAMICGWVVLFATAQALLKRWVLWFLPVAWQQLLLGLTELSGGCAALKATESIGLRLELFSLYLGFGGLCVLLQTRSVLADAGLRGHYYFPGKAAQGALSYLLAVCAQCLLPRQMRHIPELGAVLTCMVTLAACCFFLQKMKKGSSIPRPIGV